MCLQRRNNLIINGFKGAGIIEAVIIANKIFYRIENLLIIYQSQQD